MIHYVLAWTMAVIWNRQCVDESLNNKINTLIKKLEDISKDNETLKKDDKVLKKIKPATI